LMRCARQIARYSGCWNGAGWKSNEYEEKRRFTPFSRFGALFSLPSGLCVGNGSLVQAASGKIDPQQPLDIKPKTSRGHSLVDSQISLVSIIYCASGVCEQAKGTRKTRRSPYHGVSKLKHIQVSTFYRELCHYPYCLL
jgi:hypothetical protein